MRENESWRIRRRDALKGAVLGATVPFGGQLLSGCGQSTQPTAGTGTNDLQPFQAANIDWKQQHGTTIVLAAEQHPWLKALRPYLPQFEKLTGITVDLQLSGEDQYVAKMPVTLASGSATPDVYMVWAYGQAVQSRWLEPLDHYLSDTAMTDQSWYDESDIFKTARDFSRWRGKTTFGLPITAEVQTTFYRDDVIDDPSKLASFDEFKRTAMAAQNSGGIQAGVALRGKPTADAVAWPAAGYVFTYGGYLIDPSGAAALDSPEAVAGVQMYGEIVKAACPKGVSTWSWLEITNAMQKGQVAMLQDSSNASFDVHDTDKSKYAAKIKAASFPTHNGVSKPNIFHWTVGMNPNSHNKKAAWLFLLWATSKPGATQVAARGGTPPRASAWRDSRFRKNFGRQPAKTVLHGLEHADSKPMTLAWLNPNWPQVGDAFARAVNATFSSGQDAKSALRHAQKLAQRALR